MKEIHVKYAGIETTDDDRISIIYIPEQRQILQPGQKYKIVVSGLTLKSLPRK